MMTLASFDVAHVSEFESQVAGDCQSKIRVEAIGVCRAVCCKDLKSGGLHIEPINYIRIFTNKSSCCDRALRKNTCIS